MTQQMNAPHFEPCNYNFAGDIAGWNVQPPIGFPEFRHLQTDLHRTGAFTQHVATLDEYVCPVCGRTEGMSLEIGDGRPVGNSRIFDMCVSCFSAVELVAVIATEDALEDENDDR